MTTITWSGLLALVTIAATLGGFAWARRFSRETRLPGFETRGDAPWLQQTARHLLLGRIADDMTHELSQALNVITMANGNLAYLLENTNVAEPQATQLTERVRKIATHAETAAHILGHFRLFGRDGTRDIKEMTVRSALERAVIATRGLARCRGVTIELRGDALAQPLPRRHAILEMMATAALLDVLEMLRLREPGFGPPQAIMFEAMHSDPYLKISVVSPSGPLILSKMDDVAQATYALVLKLAAQYNGEMRRMEQQDHPACFLLSLHRSAF